MVDDVNFGAERIADRRNILLNIIKTLVKDFDEGVSTFRIFGVAPKNNYKYGSTTLFKDLKYLLDSGLIVKDVLYLGKGQGTRSVWKLN